MTLSACSCGHSQPTQMMAREICKDRTSPLWQLLHTRVWCPGCGMTIIDASMLNAIERWNSHALPTAVA